jgi:hypothetical protein
MLSCGFLGGTRALVLCASGIITDAMPFLHADMAWSVPAYMAFFSSGVGGSYGSGADPPSSTGGGYATWCSMVSSCSLASTRNSKRANSCQLEGQLLKQEKIHSLSSVESMSWGRVILRSDVADPIALLGGGMLKLMSRACRMVFHRLSVQGVSGAFALLNVAGVNPRQRLGILDVRCTFSQVLEVLRWSAWSKVEICS